MWMGRDVKDKIITQLSSTAYGVAAYIADINTTRSETTPAPMQLGAEADSGQYPQVYVDLGDSTITPAKGMTFDDMMEEFGLEVTAVLRGNVVGSLKDDCENYVEAILHSLEGYLCQPSTELGSFICQANGVQRADIDTMQDQTRRAVTVRFTVYNNIF